MDERETLLRLAAGERVEGISYDAALLAWGYVSAAALVVFCLVAWWVVNREAA